MKKIVGLIAVVMGLVQGEEMWAQSPTLRAEARLLELGHEDAPDEYLLVLASTQRLYRMTDGRIAAEYVISTGENGLGSDQGSYRTPLGYGE